MKYRKVSQLFSEIQTSYLQSVSFNSSNGGDITVDIKRDDLLHPILSGNKWRKLKYLLLSLEEQGYTSIASMGGRYSNFLHALSYVCYLLGWQCQLFVRAYPEQGLTSTLRDCVKWGAKINYVDRKTFRDIRKERPRLPSQIFWIKEGGMNQHAVSGMQELYMELNKQYDYICMASATGTSVSGLVIGAKQYQPNAKIIGISVLHNIDQQKRDINRMVPHSSNPWVVLPGYEFGGFAKINDELSKFMNEFFKQQGIYLETVYSGKSFYAVNDLIHQNYFDEGSKILLLHCGGMQGIRK